MRRKKMATTRPSTAPSTRAVTCARTIRLMPHWMAFGASKVMLKPVGGVNHQMRNEGASQVARMTATSAPAHIQPRTRAMAAK